MTQEEIANAINEITKVIKNKADSLGLRSDLDFTEKNTLAYIKENYPTLGSLCYMLKLAENELKNINK